MQINIAIIYLRKLHVTALYYKLVPKVVVNLKLFYQNMHKVQCTKYTKYHFLAYCDMTTDGGGWRIYSLININNKWIDYERGFGELNTEFWYGLEEIHCLTQRGKWEMRVDE